MLLIHHDWYVIIILLLIFFLVLRDTRERGRDIEQILHQYTTLVKPAFEEFCLPVSIVHGLLMYFLISHDSLKIPKG